MSWACNYGAGLLLKALFSFKALLALLCFCPALALASAPVLDENYGIVRCVDVGDKRVVALTFDLCELATSSSGFNKKLIDFLKKEEIAATLFMGGKWMSTHKAQSIDLVREPLFDLGNHAWSHGNFGIMSESAMVEQINATQAQFQKIFSETERMYGPLPHRATLPALFRFPYGRSSEKALRLLHSYGLRNIQWDVLGEPVADNTPYHVAQGVAGQVKNGSILLFHANNTPKGSYEAVTNLVKILREQGFTFVTVSALLELGTPQRVFDGYFSIPGDNVQFDTMYGADGTGPRTK